jgi:hypothetical protein
MIDKLKVMKDNEEDSGIIADLGAKINNIEKNK